MSDSSSLSGNALPETDDASSAADESGWSGWSDPRYLRLVHPTGGLVGLYERRAAAGEYPLVGRRPPERDEDPREVFVAVRLRTHAEKRLLRVDFSVRAPVPSVNPWAPRNDSAWGLWEHDVVVLFLSIDGVADYFEFQVSPLGQWFELRILEPRKKWDASFRSGMRTRARWDGRSGNWTARMDIPIGPLGWNGDSAGLKGNAFACLCEPAVPGGRTYWSLFLDEQETPDFHLPAEFRPLFAGKPVSGARSRAGSGVPQLPAEEVLERLERASDRSVAFIDVRAEAESYLSRLPGFHAHALLSDPERHDVGLAYKKEGQARAIERAVELVLPHSDARTARWMKDATGASQVIFSCWRGGMRSQTAASWFVEAEHAAAEREGRATRPVFTTAGGAKALRNALLGETAALSSWLEDSVVLAGWTGAGKTDLLAAAGKDALDIEAVARHRGSAFGRILGVAQPAQSSFENLLMWELRRHRRAGTRRLLVEDESAAVGDVRLPHEVRDLIARSPVVFVEEAVELRAERIARAYVAEACSRVPPERVRESFFAAIGRIEKKLGGLLAAQLRARIFEAFDLHRREGFERALPVHCDWIAKLLRDYYDRGYLYSFNKLERPVLFRGNSKECEAWLRNRFG